MVILGERTISFRIREKLYEELENIARKEQQDRSTVARRLLEIGLHQKKLEQAINDYSKGKTSISAAALRVGLDLRSFIDALNRSGIEIQIGLGEFLEMVNKLKTIREKKQ